MADEAIPMSASVLDVDGLWLDAATPEARRVVMREVAELVFADIVTRPATDDMAVVAKAAATSAIGNAFCCVRTQIAGIVDVEERMRASDDHVAVLVERACREGVTGPLKQFLVNEARTMCCAPTIFNAPLSLFCTYLRVATASGSKKDYVRLRQIVMLIDNTEQGNAARIWCWQKMYGVTQDPNDAERFIEAGGQQDDLVAEPEQLSMAANG